MAKFYGKIGYGHTVVKAPGVHELQITTRPVRGDVIRNIQRMSSTDKVIPDVSISNSLSIVADDYTNRNIHAMQYVEWLGAYWTISSVDVQYPRLVLTLGGVYNGPTES